jgi:uncharacterized protein YqhQ
VVSVLSVVMTSPMAEPKRTFYGGQAVLEGVMMRGRKFMAVAVRAPTGQIVVRSEPLPSRLYSGFVGRTPVLRGLTMLWDALGLGMRALMFSADVAAEGEQAQMSKPVQWSTVGVALLFGIGLFFVTPVVLGGLAYEATSSDLMAHAVEAVVRVGLLVGYVALIGLLPDIKRVYAYHGAEHMTIHAFEAGEPLVTERIKRYSAAHPRCGTAFLLLVVAISIVVFAVVGMPDLWVRVLSRIVLIPLIAGLAYEVLRFGGAHFTHPLVKLMVAPGLALQALTTRYPDEDQIEVAVAAFEEMRRLEGEIIAVQSTA